MYKYYQMGAGNKLAEADIGESVNHKYDVVHREYLYITHVTHLVLVLQSHSRDPRQMECLCEKWPLWILQSLKKEKRPMPF